MEGGFTESMKPESSSSKGEASSNNNNNNNSNDVGDFECNICFELAQDPIVTLCGHLYCWPCLYRWLHHHSQSQECPVCKALIEEEKLVPLYGRGKLTTDPRTRPIPGVEIPNRPSGQRPETAPPRPGGPETNYFSSLGLGLLGGFMPMGTARFGNTAISAGFFGFFPSFSFQFNGFPNNAMYGGAPHGFPYGFPQTVHGNGVHHGHGYRHVHGDFPHQQHHHHHHGGVATQNYDSLVKLLFIIGIFVVLALGLW